MQKTGDCWVGVLIHESILSTRPKKLNPIFARTPKPLPPPPPLSIKQFPGPCVPRLYNHLPILKTGDDAVQTSEAFI